MAFDAHAAALEYLRLRSRSEHPRSGLAFDLVERCVHCHHARFRPASGAPTTIVGGPRRGAGRRRTRRVCSSCARPFHGKDVIVARPAAVRSREGAVDALSDLARLRRVFEPRPHDWTARDWLFHQIVFFSYVLGRGTYAAIAEDGRSQALELEREWTPETVRRAVARMRRKVESRLATRFGR